MRCRERTLTDQQREKELPLLMLFTKERKTSVFAPAYFLNTKILLQKKKKKLLSFEMGAGGVC